MSDIQRQVQQAIDGLVASGAGTYCHTAGVPAVPLSTTVEDLCDWDTMCTAIADSELWWEGTKAGYHAYTFGYLVGEIVGRTTGKPISRVLLEDVSGPLGGAEAPVADRRDGEPHRRAERRDPC